ncbi:MAG: hypothetical protein GY809_04385, partial [Planctomycetes bacterium]|nr:hypothetical protein [Planctomycetota bacterium]
MMQFTGGTGSNSVVEFDGLYIEGGLSVDAQSCKDISLRHCTLIPGRAINEEGAPVFPSEASITLSPDSTEHVVSLYRSITGPVIMEENGGKICAAESIMDHPQSGFVIAGQTDGSLSGPDLELDTCTLTGQVSARQVLLATGTLFKKTVE